MREVMEGRMEGKRTRGRPRKGMLDEFLEVGRRVLCTDEEESAR